MVRSKDSWKTNPSEQVECVKPDGEVVVKRRCGRPGCRTPCANPEDGQPRCESCAIVGRVGANYRQKKSTLKKKCREENATLKSHLPRVVWFKDNDEWMKECKQHMEKQGIVILRNWMEEGWAESLENDLKTCGYFDLRADGGAPVVPGNIQEHYLSQEELLPDTKTNELRKEMMEIVRRLSRYMFNLDHEDVQVEIAALKKGAHCPDKQVWHADDIHQRNIKGLCYISRKCTPAKILPYETLRGDPIPEEMSHYDGSQDFRQKILDRFGGVFERESVIAAAESYDSADLLHPFCEAGDLAIFYGDFPHAGWDNVVTGEDKYFYFINSSANGAVDVNFQFHVGWYCNVKGGWTTEAYWGEEKTKLVKKHVGALVSSLDACRGSVNVFYNNAYPKPEHIKEDHASLQEQKGSTGGYAEGRREHRGLDPNFEVEYKTPADYEIFVTETARKLRDAATAEGRRKKRAELDQRGSRLRDGKLSAGTSCDGVASVADGCGQRKIVTGVPAMRRLPLVSKNEGGDVAVGCDGTARDSRASSKHAAAAGGKDAGDVVGAAVALVVPKRRLPLATAGAGTKENEVAPKRRLPVAGASPGKPRSRRKTAGVGAG